jgi:hypothetical protein
MGMTMNGDHVNVSTYVILEEGCSLDFSVIGSGQVEVTCGSPLDGLQFILDPESLRQFLTLGSKALAEMDVLFEQEEAEREAEEHREVAAS